MDKEEIYHQPAQNLSAYNRTLCDVLADIRELSANKTKADAFPEVHLQLIHSLGQEAQVYANRMEAKLSDINEYERLKTKFKRIKEKIKALDGDDKDVASLIEDIEHDF